MERLWSPWRSEYVTKADESDGCIFCASLADPEPDPDAVLYRGAEAFVLLNAFPYNTGHVMVAPVRHVGDLEGLSETERHELQDVTIRSVAAIRRALSPEGFNVGMNLGRVAGAGIPNHLHVHVVPRWGGDTNFMPVVADTKVLPELLADTAAKLRGAFEKL